MMLIIYLGIRHILTFFVPQAKRIGESFFGTHDVCFFFPCYMQFCKMERLIIRSESRHTQQCSVKVSPVQTNYAPDGRSLLYASAGHQLFFMTLGKENENAKEQWSFANKDAVRVGHFRIMHLLTLKGRRRSQVQQRCSITLEIVLS